MLWRSSWKLGGYRILRTQSSRKQVGVSTPVMTRFLKQQPYLTEYLQSLYLSITLCLVGSDVNTVPSHHFTEGLVLLCHALGGGVTCWPYLSSLISLLPDFFFLPHDTSLQTPLPQQIKALGDEAVRNPLDTTWLLQGPDLSTQRPCLLHCWGYQHISHVFKVSTFLGLYLFTPK